jgi:hypothetical protein
MYSKYGDEPGGGHGSHCRSTDGSAGLAVIITDAIIKMAATVFKAQPVSLARAAFYPTGLVRVVIASGLVLSRDSALSLSHRALVLFPEISYMCLLASVCRCAHLRGLEPGLRALVLCSLSSALDLGVALSWRSITASVWCVATPERAP